VAAPRIPTYIATYMPTHPPTSPPTQSTYFLLPFYLPIHLPTDLLTHPPTYLPTHPPTIPHPLSTYCAAGDEETTLADETPPPASDEPAAADRLPNVGLPEGAGKLPHLLQALQLELSTSAGALGESLRSYTEQIGTVIVDGNISLVEGSDLEVFFVQWTSAISRRGRRVTLDQQNRIITIVPAAVPVLDFAGARILIPNTGQFMVRRTKAFRPLMSAWCLDLRLYFQALRYAGPIVGHECIACRTADALGLEGYRRPSADLAESYICCACLRSWHNECACAANVGTWVLRRGTLATVDTITFVCPVCTAAGRSHMADDTV